VRRYDEAHGVMRAELSALATDPAGNLWIGTMGRGAMRLAADGLVSFDEQDGLGSRAAGSILRESDGTLLVATSNFYINRYDGQRFHAIRLRMPDNAGDDRRRIVRDHRGEWWTVATSGVFRFAAMRRLDDLARAAPVASYSKRSGLAGDDCMRLLEDSRGDVWFGYRLPGRQVLTRWERASNTFHHYSDTDGLPAFAPVRAIVEDRSGAVWIAFWEGGLARYRDGRFIRLTASQGVSETALSALYLDRAGGLWFSSADRIGRIEHPEAEKPEVSRIISGPFSGGGPQMIAEDDFGHLYFGGVNGIDRLDPRSGAMRHFSTLDGLASNEVVAGLCDRDGAIWFTTTGGVSRLRPARAPVRHAGPMLVTGVAAGGRTIPLSDLGEHDVTGLTIGPGSNQLRIEFTAPELFRRRAGPLSIHARGCRSPVGRARHRSQRSICESLTRTISFPRRVGGRRRHSGARATRYGGLHSARSRLAALVVRGDRNRTDRAGAGGLSSVARRSSAGGRARPHANRDRLARRARSELVADCGPERGGEGRSRWNCARYLAPTEQIAATARDLLSSTNDLVWSIHPRRDTVKGLLTRIRSFATELLEGRGIGCTASVAPDVENLPLSAELRWHLLLILKEALHNVVRHSGARHVALTARRDQPGRLAIELRDDGRGLALGDDERATEQGRGHGLRNMEARAKEIGGRLTIESDAESGTSVTIRFPG
jgi:streptogramin lyase/anti-sigma regulatory factor (Ser/Thr protein kinase)